MVDWQNVINFKEMKMDAIKRYTELRKTMNMSDAITQLQIDILADDYNKHKQSQPEQEEKGLQWRDISNRFYIEYDKQISSGEYNGKMVIMFVEWLSKNYKIPEKIVSIKEN